MRVTPLTAKFCVFVAEKQFELEMSPTSTRVLQTAGVVKMWKYQTWGYACDQYWSDAEANDVSVISLFQSLSDSFIYLSFHHYI